MTPNDRELPDAWQYGADGAAEDGVSFVAEGRAGGGNAVLRLGDGDEGRRWNAGRFGGTPRPTGRWRSRGTRDPTMRGWWVSECAGT